MFLCFKKILFNRGYDKIAFYILLVKTNYIIGVYMLLN